jgi:hypothetical protein
VAPAEPASANRWISDSDRPGFGIGTKSLRAFGRFCCAMGALCASPVLAASNNVRITKLGDVTFGTIANFSTDAVDSQSVCVYANTTTNGYNVRASGSGSGGAFTLASGGNSLAYDVQWSSAAGQSSGAQLSPNVALTGQISTAMQQTCNSGPTSTASLIVVLRSSAISSAAAGFYNGALTLVIGPE